MIHFVASGRGSKSRALFSPLEKCPTDQHRLSGRLRIVRSCQELPKPNGFLSIEPGFIAHTYKPSPEEAETGELLQVPGQSGLHCETKRQGESQT